MGKASEIIKSVNPHSRAHRYAVSLSASPLWSGIPRAMVTSPCPSDPGSLQSTAEPTESSRLVVLSANTPDIPTAPALQPLCAAGLSLHPTPCFITLLSGRAAAWQRCPGPSCPQLSPAVRVPQGPVPGRNSAPLKIAARGCCCAGTPGGSGARGCPGHSAAGPASCPPGLGRAGRSSPGLPGRAQLALPRGLFWSPRRGRAPRGCTGPVPPPTAAPAGEVLPHEERGPGGGTRRR